MSFISTALSSISGFASDLTSTLGAVSPLVDLGFNIANQFGGGGGGGRRSSAAPPSAMPVPVMPGGAPVITRFNFGGPQRMPNMPTAQPALFGGLGQAFSGGLDAIQGQAGCITPVQTRAGLRMPRLVQMRNPVNPNLIETYVRAPRPRFKVSVSGPRKRRCSGGR